LCGIFRFSRAALDLVHSCMISLILSNLEEKGKVDFIKLCNDCRCTDLGEFHKYLSSINVGKGVLLLRIGGKVN